MNFILQFNTLCYFLIGLILFHPSSIFLFPQYNRFAFQRMIVNFQGFIKVLLRKKEFISCQRHQLQIQ